MPAPGTFYIPSGRFSLQNTILGTLIGCALAFVIGAIYSYISTINPLIYLNFLLLAGAVLALIFILNSIKFKTHSRSKGVNLLVAFIVCFFTWYAHWCIFINHEIGIDLGSLLINPIGLINTVFYVASERTLSIGRFGSDGATFSGGWLAAVYIIEFGAFMFPLIMVARDHDYYCEDCNAYYKNGTGLIEDSDQFMTKFNYAGPGQYGFVGELPVVGTMHEIRKDPATKPKVIELNYHYCPQCKRKSIMDFSSKVLRYGDKNKIELGKEKSLVKGVYIDQKTEDVMRSVFRIA